MVIIANQEITVRRSFVLRSHTFYFEGTELMFLLSFLGFEDPT